MRYLLLASIILSGCTLEGSISKEDLNKQMKCVDFRDGEVFTFNSNNITDAKSTLGGEGSFRVTTDQGDNIRITSSMEAFIKCKQVEL